MILPDVNVLIHAHNDESAVHERAREWWSGALSGVENVGLAWVTLLGFIRISTSRRAFDRPLPVEEALARMEEWLAQPNVRIVEPTARHAEILAGLLRKVGVAANLTTDAHLATLAVEHRAVVYSTDTDFARFPGIAWKNPCTS